MGKAKAGPIEARIFHVILPDGKPGIGVETPYHPSLPEKFKAWQGRWDPDKKVWYLIDSWVTRVVDLVKEVFPGCNVTLSASAPIPVTYPKSSGRGKWAPKPQIIGDKGPLGVAVPGIRITRSGPNLDDVKELAKALGVCMAMLSDEEQSEVLDILAQAAGEGVE